MKRLFFLLFIFSLCAEEYIGIVGYCPCKVCCKDSIDRSSYKEGDITAPKKFPIGTMIYADGILLGTIKQHYPKESDSIILRRFFRTHHEAKSFRAKIVII